MTGHYNGYFNANELVLKGAGTLAANHKEDYDKLLPIYIHGTEEEAKAIFPDMEKAIARGAHIYAEIIGFGSSNDSSHVTQPSIEGQTRAMRKALNEAGIQPSQLDYINAHGTGTKLNDSTEAASISKVCGTGIPISSTKSLHGHIMGATAAIEFIACMMAIKEQSLPPTANFTSPDEGCELDFIPNIGRKNVKVHTIMSNSFAFGGTSGVLIAKKIS
jgi:3-oxoacyl-[acyl-carrier-protein] synthase II